MEGQYFNETNPPEPWQAYGPNSTCTLDLCSVKWSVFTYRPSLAANIVFACLFGMAFFIHLYQGWRNKTYFFAGAILCGCAGEVIGYIGRISLYFNPFSFPAFVIATGMYLMVLNGVVEAWTFDSFTTVHPFTPTPN